MRMWKQVLVALLAGGAGAATVDHIARRRPQDPARPSLHVPAQPRRPTAFGINLGTLMQWNNERAFMNLMAGVQWQAATASGWQNFDTARIDRDGTILSLLPGEKAAGPMSHPPRSFQGEVRIHCAFAGKGEVTAFNAKSVAAGKSTLDFVWPKNDGVSILISKTDPADPVRHIDCREADADRAALFDPLFVNSLRPYKVVRFQGWQSTNVNTPVDWDRRPSATADVQDGPEGAAVENMVALANQAHLSPWFMMPWNADNRYETSFARYVHDHLDPSLQVYVELGNEVWNDGFPVSAQALKEGKAEGLGADDHGARMRRYAEHAVATFKIWQAAFGPDKARLVRVLAGQAVWPDGLRAALDYRDTAAQVDAIAMAPYFGFNFLYEAKSSLSDTAGLFRELPATVDKAADFIRQDKAMADSYGLRLIAYEAGQHITYYGDDKTVIGRLNRDPRMEAIYDRYLAAWSREAGDLITIFANQSPLSSQAAWGLAEYPGQAMAETPKRRAVLAAIAAGKNGK